MSSNSGLTLIELIAAIAIWLVLFLSVSQLITHTARVSSYIIVNQNILENVRITLDALAVNIQMSDEIVLQTSTNGMLQLVTLYQIDPEQRRHPYQFRFDANLPYYHSRHGRLEIGSRNTFNEFSSNLSEVRLEFCAYSQAIHITVSSVEYPPLTLTSTVDVRYKTIRER